MAKKPPAILSKPQTDSSNGSQSLSRTRYAVERARMLFGLYRKGEANDPETYAAGIAAILAEYDEEVIKQVTDPRIGIARQSKWLPSIAEVSDECDKVKARVASERFMLSEGFSWNGRKWVK